HRPKGDETPACRPGGSGWTRIRSFVDVLRVFQDGLDVHPAWGAIGIQSLEETAATPGMAGNAAFLLDLEQDDVAVAIKAYFPQELAVSRFLTLAPQTLAGPRPVHGATCLCSLAPRFGVHPGHHQSGAVRRILRDRRDEAVFIEAHASQPVSHAAHGSSLTLTPCAARNSLASRTVYSP